MLKALLERLLAVFDRPEPARDRPVHGDHGRARDVDYTFNKKRYTGSQTRQYRVHLPPAYGLGNKLPVVMVLHGCDQNHEDVQQVSDFDRLADKHGFIVVYPFVTSYDTPRMDNCWAFWSKHHNRSGAGEVEDLWRILSAVRSRFKADADRLHVAGLSSGASMAIALLVTRCDKIASGAEIAGLPYTESAMFLGHANPLYKPTRHVVAAMEAEMGNKKRQVPLMIVHAKRDRFISVKAATKVRESWAESFAIDTSEPSWSKSGSTNGTAWEHHRYTDGTDGNAIETLLLDHNEHGWYGGQEGKYGFTDTLDVSEMIWSFFASNRLNSASSTSGLFRRHKSAA